MRKTLFIHLGMPKAGSTALQEFLYQNRINLEKQGLLYPDPRSLEQFSRNPRMMTGHHIVPMYITGFFWAYFPKKEGISSAHIFDHIRKQLLDSPAPAGILSSEAIWFMLNRQDVVDEFVHGFSDFNLKAIVYLRRQDDHIQSGYNECIKSSGYTMTVDEFIDDRFLDPSNHYYRHLMLWLNAIGKEHLMVRLYDRNILTNGSIFDDFLQKCGLHSPKDLQFAEKDANPRLSLNALMFQRFINLFIHDVELRRQFSEILLEYSALEDAATKKAFATHNLLSQDQKSRILNHYRDENHKAAVLFLNQAEQNIFLNENPMYSQSGHELTLDKTIEIYAFIKSVNAEIAGHLNLAARSEDACRLAQNKEGAISFLNTMKSHCQ